MMSMMIAEDYKKVLDFDILFVVDIDFGVVVAVANFVMSDLDLYHNGFVDNHILAYFVADSLMMNHYDL